MGLQIYVASSWRNTHYPSIVERLRAEGHDCYDFRHEGFSWSEISADWADWTMQEYIEALEHPAAARGYDRDFSAMKWADCCVLVLPSGRSAHIEAGWFVGQGKPVVVLQPERCEPELMYKLATAICSSIDEVVGWLTQLEVQPKDGPAEVLRDLVALLELKGTPPFDEPDLGRLEERARALLAKG